MAFVRKKTKVYSWPIDVKKPSVKKVGEFETTRFIGKFNRLKRSELNSFEEATEYDALERVLVGWEDINEEDGTPVEFNKENLKEFAEDTDFVAGVLDAFRDFYGNSQVKN